MKPDLMYPIIFFTVQVNRHDGKSDKLGLDVLDEPTANQSDPSVLDLQLRSIHKDLKVNYYS